MGILALLFLSVKAGLLNFLSWSQFLVSRSQFHSCQCQSEALEIPHLMVVRPLAGRL